MIGVLHIRDLQPGLMFFFDSLRASVFRRCTGIEPFVPSKHLGYKTFMIPSCGILTGIGRAAIKANTSPQQFVGTFVCTVFGEVNSGRLIIIVCQYAVSKSELRTFVGQKGNAHMSFTNRSSFELKEGRSFLEKSLSFL